MNPRPVRAERHLSDFESLMWTLEADPQLRAGFANLTLLDGPLNIEALRARLQRAAAVIPQLRKIVVPGVARMAPPAWRDDPAFDIHRHVRLADTAGPVALKEACDLAVEFAHRRYDRAHPLWEFLVIPELTDGRSAMLQRMHHIVTDGVGALRMSEQFIDLTRHAEVPEPVEVPAPEDVGEGLIDRVRITASHNLQRQVSMVDRGARGGVGLVRHPSRIPGLIGSATRLTRSVVQEATDFDRRLSPLWTERSDRYSMALLAVPLDAARETAKRRGCSINDVFVAAAAGGAGAYHREMGSPVDALRMAMPVNVREDRSAAGNAFSMSRTKISTVADPLSRLEAIHEQLADIRSSAAVTAVASAAGLANLLPRPVLIRAARSQVGTLDFTTSNIRGAPIPVYMAGAEVLGNHPVGPLAGTAFNLTALSYNGSLDMGLHIDTGAVAEPDLLHRCIERSFTELLAL